MCLADDSSTSLNNAAETNGEIAMFFAENYNDADTYQDRMKLYCNLPDDLKECNFINNLVDAQQRLAYKLLGKQELENCSYNCS